MLRKSILKWSPVNVRSIDFLKYFYRFISKTAVTWIVKGHWIVSEVLFLFTVMIQKL
jgi:hypothetical protein